MMRPSNERECWRLKEERKRRHAPNKRKERKGKTMIASADASFPLSFLYKSVSVALMATIPLQAIQTELLCKEKMKLFCLDLILQRNDPCDPMVLIMMKSSTSGWRYSAALHSGS
ncbi:unnamed protein product [Prorocentrum cordatum]|uniref:Uncharacterized protein n=1 Tax=Prorocentrum cordatum TaxID=2364126 RepID=A0ABN9XUB6_9DINO|nr:unnamed protein product [Polarella glacialis]CAK0903012.1 unnamed protein product [Polarella glacialis]CAK0903014.1 unnamed protein product [Polarella glacialis]|mmetsp:Transcript_11752/g.31414  ORF Transcript_11752/g.31414 Transcript_11752/m.31414 type:complete len:115 (+) Transcript_11752:596-940(+)